MKRSIWRLAQACSVQAQMRRSSGPLIKTRQTLPPPRASAKGAPHVPPHKSIAHLPQKQLRALHQGAC